MKIRSGFVSNSSSSSFTCDICHTTEEVCDGCGESGEWFSCENGHTWCSGHEKNIFNKPAEEIREVLIKDAEENYSTTELTDEVLRIEELPDADLLDEYKEYLSETGDSSDIPAENCPICNFSVFLYDDIEEYLIKKSGKPLKEIKAQIKAEFPNREAFDKYIK
jgi:hypothetical protein